MNNKELCMECFGEGVIARSSKAIKGRLVKSKCNNCKGSGAVPAIINQSYKSNLIYETAD